MISRPVSSPWEPAAGWRLTASRPVTSRRISSSRHCELERALRRVVVGERMEVAEARQADEPLVDARVVLHRAGAERVEAGVDAEVAGRELGEVAEHLRLGELGEPRRRLAGERRPGSRAPAGPASGTPRPRRPGARLLVDQLHRLSSSAGARGRRPAGRSPRSSASRSRRRAAPARARGSRGRARSRG